MKEETQAIEVEVVAIDGLAPAAAERAADEPRRRDWRGLQGRIVKLDPKWWPLWVVLGTVAVFLALTVGAVLAAVWLVLAILRGIARRIFG
jgi:hypothetical protein